VLAARVAYLNNKQETFLIDRAGEAFKKRRLWWRTARYGVMEVRCGAIEVLCGLTGALRAPVGGGCSSWPL